MRLRVPLLARPAVFLCQSLASRSRIPIFPKFRPQGEGIEHTANELAVAPARVPLLARPAVFLCQSLAAGRKCFVVSRFKAQGKGSNPTANKLAVAPAHRGVTLIELIVVVAIVGALAAMLLPAVLAARESARRIECQHHLRQLGVAASIHIERQSTLPIGCIGCRFTPPPPLGPPAPQRFISWNVQLLPFLERGELWDAFDFTVPSYRPENKAVGANVMEVFLCPSTVGESIRQPRGLWKGTAFTDYAGIYGVEGAGRTATDPNSAHWLLNDSLGVMLYEQGLEPREISDGLSLTAMIAETLLRRQIESEWINGHNVFAQEATTPINGASGLGNDIGGPHAGGASLVFCDGHVEFVAETIGQHVLVALLTKAGGEL